MALPGIRVAGFASCPYHLRAIAAVREALGPERAAQAAWTFPTRAAYRAWLLKGDHPPARLARARSHTSSPLVWQQLGEGGGNHDDEIELVGGCDDLLERLAATQYICYGAENSPYSIKVRAYFRFKGIPCKWVVRYRDEAGYKTVARIPIVPAVRKPDGTGLQDSTPIMEMLDRTYAHAPHVPSAHPPDPLRRFVSQLLEEHGDEWANKEMFHYRWARPIDQRIVALRLVHDMLGPNSEADDDTLSAMADTVRSRMRGRGFAVGSNATTGPLIEMAFVRSLAALERHLAGGRAFLLGGRPSLGDFGLAAQYYQALIDPTAGQIMTATAPRVVAWCTRVMLTPVSGGGAGGSAASAEGASGWEPWSVLAPTLEPLLRDLVGNVFLRWSAANTAAIDNGDKVCVVEIPGLGLWRNDVKGPQKYQRKSLGWLREKYAQASVHSPELVALMRRTGCHEFLSPSSKL